MEIKLFIPPDLEDELRHAARFTGQPSIALVLDAVRQHVAQVKASALQGIPDEDLPPEGEWPSAGACFGSCATPRRP